jgi:hypothetical protein
MNSELKKRIFDIPQNILDNVNHAVIGLNGSHAHGLQRAKKLLGDKKVKYGISIDRYLFDKMKNEEASVSKFIQNLVKDHYEKKKIQ